MNRRKFEALVKQQVKAGRRVATPKEVAEIQKHYKEGCAFTDATWKETIDILSKHFFNIRVAESLRPVVCR